MQLFCRYCKFISFTVRKFIGGRTLWIIEDLSILEIKVRTFVNKSKTFFRRGGYFEDYCRVVILRGFFGDFRDYFWDFTVYNYCVFIPIKVEIYVYKYIHCNASVIIWVHDQQRISQLVWWNIMVRIQVCIKVYVQCSWGVFLRIDLSSSSEFVIHVYFVLSFRVLQFVSSWLYCIAFNTP